MTFPLSKIDSNIFLHDNTIHFENMKITVLEISRSGLSVIKKKFHRIYRIYKTLHWDGSQGFPTISL